MTEIEENIKKITDSLKGASCRLVAISKTKPNELLMEAYQAGQRDFGENKVQEMVTKYETLPKDIQWHMVGHLQRNKIKSIAPFVHLIHSVDSIRLLDAIHTEGLKINRVIDCLLQVHIAMETTKFGFDKSEILELFISDQLLNYSHVRVVGLMGMATFTEDESQIRKEFSELRNIYESVNEYGKAKLIELSMGMSGDYPIAVELGSTLIRVGSSIFGERNYTT